MSELPATRRRVAVIYNPVAGARQRRRLRRLLRRLRKAGHEVSIHHTDGPGAATTIARGLDPAAVDVVLAAGGDGTIREVAGGLIGRPLPLAVAPLGTANVMAWELGHGMSIETAARIVAEGTVVAVHPALAGEHGFLLMASAGLDARVVAGVDPGLKRRIGKLAYVLAAGREILRRPPPPIALEIDGTPVRAALAVVTHAAHYAGPFVIAPRARLGDETLTVVLVEDGSRLGLLRCGLALLFNRVSRLPGVETRTARSVRFTGPVGAPVQSDGDVLGTIPMTVTLDRRMLSLLVRDPGRVAAVADAAAAPSTDAPAVNAAAEYSRGR